MTSFYSRAEQRQAYEAMLNADAHRQPATEHALCEAALARQPRQILEVGCGDGRLYRELRARGYGGSYVGVEVSEEVIGRNRVTHPEALWRRGSISDPSASTASFDVVFAYFVLEHCVFPARALEQMVAAADKHGAVLLVFPDFAEMGRFASQAIGRRRGLTREHLKRGAVVDALVGFYDARIRLPRALRHAAEECGPFPVNLNPRCLFDGDPLEPDVDAVYIASAAEVERWALDRGLHVSFPAGRDGHFRENVLLQIEKHGTLS